MKKLGYYATIFRAGLFFGLITAAYCETECRNQIRDEIYKCNNGCCGSSPEQYCCSSSSYMAYLIVAAVLVCVLLLVVVSIWYKKKTVSRRRTRPSGVVLRMTEDRSPNLPQPCINGSDRANFNYYHLQWVYGQPIAPPPYPAETAPVYSTHAQNHINGSNSGQTMDWQQHRISSNNRTIFQNSPPPPYSFHDNNYSTA